MNDEILREAFPDTHYVILVEHSGGNDYWTDDGYPWQGTVKSYEDDEGRLIVVHYRIVQIKERYNYLWFSDIGKNKWEPLTAGDMIDTLDAAKEYATLLHPDATVMRGRSVDCGDNYWKCYALRHPNILAVNGLDYYVVLPKKEELLKQGKCEHYKFSILLGDSSAWWSKDAEVIVDHKNNVTVENESQWTPRDGWETNYRRGD